MADEQHLYIRLVRKGIKNSEETCVILDKISIDKTTYYKPPANRCVLKTHHKELCLRKTVLNAAESIVPINGERNIRVALKDDLKKVYLDEDANVCFDGIPLEEVHETGDHDRSLNTSASEAILLQRIKELTQEKSLMEQQKGEPKLNEIDRKFVIEKFNDQQSSREWIQKFESECDRHKVKESASIIECLKYFLEGSAVDWYYANLKKLTFDDWQPWKNSFLLVYADKGWSSVRQAFAYRYIGGSLIDYAIKKERLCLEAESKMTIGSRINMIVVNLPSVVQEKLNREALKTVDDLYAELRGLDDAYSGKKKRQPIELTSVKKERAGDQKVQNSDQKVHNYDQKVKPAKKDPCFMCEFLGLVNPPRFHSPKDCLNKKKYVNKFQEVNFVLENESGLEDDLAKMMSNEPPLSSKN